MAPNESGYEYEPEALERAAGRFKSATSYLDAVGNQGLNAVDAGASSDVFNAALARVQQAAVILSQAMDDISSKIDTAKGSYDDIENTTEGAMRMRQPESIAPPYTPGPLASDPDKQNSYRQEAG